MVLKVVPAGSPGEAPDAARLLIVTHGPERGPEPGFLRPLLARLAEHRPELASRITLHATGADAPDLSLAGLVLFALAPDAERDFPECWTEARRLALRADLRWIPTLNAPGAGRVFQPTDGPDTRKGRAPGSLLARLHHRKRAFVLGGEVVNGELLLSQTQSRDPKDSIFARGSRLPRPLAALAGGRGRLREEATAADRAFFDAGPEATQALAGAVEAAGLDFASVEYVTTPKGAAQVLRIGPIGDLAEGTLGLFSRRRGTERRVERVLDRFAETLDAALARELQTPFQASAA